MTPSIGIIEALMAKDVYEFRNALNKVNFIMLNFVFGDTKGNIAWHTTGKIPIRKQRTGSEPYHVKAPGNNWVGWIPANKMPQVINPRGGWISTCNHKTVNYKYPYYLSSYFAPKYRFRRIKEIISGNTKKTTIRDHWNYMRDTKNLLGKEIAPVMVKHLMSFKDTEKLGKILSQWDYHDDKEKAAPLIFQALMRRFAYNTFQDELGDKLAKKMLSLYYVWNEKLKAMILRGKSAWFDDVTTERKEIMKDIFHKSAQEVYDEFSKKLGENPEDWKWGDVHTISFVSPLMKKGILKGLFGGGTWPMSGSGETLYRAIYPYNDPFNIDKTAVLRMVADLGDNEKVAAVISGGTTGRTFHRNNTDQLESYMDGTIEYWWFTDKLVKEHGESELTLVKK